MNELMQATWLLDLGIVLHVVTNGFLVYAYANWVKEIIIYGHQVHILA